jgi:predicted DNA-binding transcriptional regulator AlpA
MVRILRERAAAETLGLKRRTLQRYRELGIGPPYVRVGLRAVAYREADLEAWLLNRRNLPEQRRGEA